MFFVESKYFKLTRNRRVADALKNTTGARNTVDMETVLKISKLNLSWNLNSVIQMASHVPQALPVYLDQRETKDPGDEEDRRDEQETQETKALWDHLEWAESKVSWDL